MKLIAVVNGGQIYTSWDLGENWFPYESARDWSAVASSVYGRLIAVDFGGQIYTSDPTTIEVQNTTIGTTGWISGGQYDAIELLYIGENTFTILSHEGYLVVQ